VAKKVLLVNIPKDLEESMLEELAHQLSFIKKLAKKSCPLSLFEPIIKITLHPEIDADILYASL